LLNRLVQSNRALLDIRRNRERADARKEERFEA
jgi:hypothetical protein